MTNNQVDITKANALKAINGFIRQEEREAIDEYDFDCIINIIKVGPTEHYGSPRVAATKYLRKVTSSATPIKWALSYKDSDHSSFVRYVEENSFQEMGVTKEGEGLGLKESLDIVKFVEANLAYLTYEE